MTLAVVWVLLAPATTAGSLSAPVRQSQSQFAAYSCDTVGQPTVGGNVYSAIRIAHSKQPGPPHCPGYNASADPLGPCFVSPEFAKEYLQQIPAGHRAISLEGQPSLYTVANGAEKTVPRGLDCFDEIAAGVRGPWLDDWSRVVRARFEAWFGRLHAIGGAVDIVMLDWENNAPYFSWVAQPGGAVALAKDLRWPKLRTELNVLGSHYNISFPLVPTETEMKAWVKDESDMHQWVWTDVVHRLVARTVNETIVAPLQKLYPRLVINNFSHKHRSEPVAGAWWPYQFGNGATPPAGTGCHVGTHQGGAFCECCLASVAPAHTTCSIM